MKRSSPFWPAAMLFSIITLAACSDPEIAKRKYLDSGNAAFESKAYAEAVLAYRNVLRIDPLHAGARQKLAEAYERQGDLRNASREYIRVADVLPNDAAAQRTASRALLLGRQFTDAQTRARRAVELEPTNIEGHILLGTAIAGTKDLEGAIEQIEEAIAIEPASGAGHMSMGTLRLVQGHKAEAQASFEKAVKLDEKNVDAHLALATYHLNVGAPREAEDAIKGALRVDPANGRANRAMGLVLISTGRAEEAEPFIRAAVDAVKTPQAELALSDYYTSIRRPEQARKILERLATSDALFASATVRLAVIDYASGQREAAHQRLETVLKRVPASREALAVKGSWLLEEGQSAEAARFAEAAVQAEPNSATARFLLGRTMNATGDRKRAEEAFQEVLRLNPRAGAAQIELARLSLAAGKPEAGVQFASDAVTNQPRNNDARLLLVRGLLAKGDVSRAATELQPLVREFPYHPTVLGMKGTLLVLQKDYDGARREFELALAREPGQIDALKGITALDADSGQIGLARERIAARLLLNPRDPALLLLGARADLRAKDYAAAEQRLRALIEVQPANLVGYELLARAYYQQGRLDDARREFEGLAERKPDSVAAHTFVGMIFETQKQREQAEKAYRRAVDVNPTAAGVAANNLAYLYADRDHNLDEALALARSAAEQLQDNPAVADTLGLIFYKKAMPDLAIQQFLRSLEKDPQNPLYHFHLGLAHVLAGNAAKARESLEQALKLDPSFERASEARQALAGLKS